jgi:hypothetical protein
MKYLQLLFFLLVNSLFVAKYGSRFFSEYLFFVIAYVFFIAMIFFFIEKKKNFIDKIPFKIVFFVLLIVGIVGSLFLLSIIDPYTLQVDRWSAIHNFIEYLFAGQYPYAAQTHLDGYGSPFPVWQFFHIPFYLLGNTSYGFVFSFAAAAGLMLWLTKSYRHASLFLFFSLLSPAFWYEVGVRSDLLYNLILCLLTIAVIEKKQISISTHAWILGLVCGLFLSTRLIVGVPFFIYFFRSFLKTKLKFQVIFVSTIILVFALSFLPFLLWDGEMLLFFQYSPFVLQTRQGTSIELIAVCALILFLSFRWNFFSEYCGTVSICLFALMSVSFLRHIFTNGFCFTLFESGFDITYFSTALPFVIFILSGVSQYMTKIKPQ